MNRRPETVENTLTLTKNLPHTIYWLDGYQRTTTVTDYGQAVSIHAGGYLDFPHCFRCWPSFYNPEWLNIGNTSYWLQKTYPATINTSTGECTIAAQPSSDHRQGHNCPAPTTSAACNIVGWHWNSFTSTCSEACPTGEGFSSPAACEQGVTD